MANSKSVVFVLTFLLFMETIKFGLSNLACFENERQALVRFKQGIIDPSNRLSSWEGQDCCVWKGVGCSKAGNVVKLDLQNPFPFNVECYYDLDEHDLTYESACLHVHEVNPSLLELKHLKYLDLSWNNFSGINIPDLFGSFQELEYLNLSSAWFGGVVPHDLGNLSALSSLDLSTQTSLKYYDFPELIVDTLHWTSSLLSLQHLDMSRLKFHNIPADSFGALTSLPSLVELHLRKCQLDGNSPLFQSLANLTSLAILDLSSNNIEGPNPNAIRKMISLRVLVLSFNHLSSNHFAPIVSSPSFLDNLEMLDLSGNGFNGSFPNWLYHMKKLRKLDLSYNSFQGPIPTFFGALPSLKELHLKSNWLINGSVPIFLGNLEVLDLGFNQLSGPIPKSLGKMTELRELYLCGTQLSGQIPRSLGRLLKLTVLDLHFNQLSGQIPMSLGRLSKLRILQLLGNQISGHIPMYIGSLNKKLTELNLGSNQLNGTLPESVGHLSELTELDLSNNSLNGVLSEMHFAKLFRLKDLDLSMNSLSLNISSGWVPPFQLVRIRLGDCRVGPHFPGWLRTQTKIIKLDMSNAGISDSIPNWFKILPSRLYSIDLSGNEIHGNVPNFVKSSTSDLSLDLSSSRLEGPFPYLPSNLVILDLSNNTIDGPIPKNIDDMLPALSFLDLSSNYLTGSVTHSFCKMEQLRYLGLSKNYLSGNLPRCWSDSSELNVINLSSNNLSGTIPSSFCQLPHLESLHLSKNILHGELSSGWQHCTSLSLLDLGENILSGEIPSFIGDSVLSLRILRLRSNNYSGSISPKLCRLNKLQILDLACNNLSGSIPRCIGNFTAMLFNQSDPYVFPSGDALTEVIKGRELEYIKILSLLINLDLSSNDLTGHIPQGLTRFSGLIGLNLSKNHFTGSIPKEIGRMISLQSLDLSLNNLSGPVPQSISSLTSLSHLNISWNNLSGQIPSGNQLQTLDDPSIYKGNDELCGFPLENKCLGNGPSPAHIFIDNKGEYEDVFSGSWFYIGLLSGVAVGFWGVCCVLLFNKTWRYAYFRLLDDMNDRLIALIQISIARVKYKIELQ